MSLRAAKLPKYRKKKAKKEMKYRLRPRDPGMTIDEFMPLMVAAGIVMMIMGIFVMVKSPVLAKVLWSLGGFALALFLPYYWFRGRHLRA